PHKLAKLRQRRGGGARVDGQAAVRDVGKALLAVHGHAQRRMRSLHGPGHHAELLDVVEPAVIAETVPRPCEADNLKRFVKARAVLRHGNAKAVELRGDGAAPHTEIEAPAREEIRGWRPAPHSSAGGAAAGG